jgi:hypothetical protein
MVPEWPINLPSSISNLISGQTIMRMDLYQTLDDTYWQHAMVNCMDLQHEQSNLTAIHKLSNGPGMTSKLDQIYKQSSTWSDHDVNGPVSSIRKHLLTTCNDWLHEPSWYEGWCHHILNAIFTRMVKHSKYWWVNPLVVCRHMRADPSLIQQQ